MSTKDRTGDKPTDADAQTDTESAETTPTAHGPLTEALALLAPFARNDDACSGVSR